MPFVPLSTQCQTSAVIATAEPLAIRGDYTCKSSMSGLIDESFPRGSRKASEVLMSSDTELWYGLAFLLSLPCLLIAALTLSEQGEAPDWRVPTRNCVARWGWFGVGFGAFMVFLGGCGAIVSLQGGGSDSNVVTEYRGTAGQLLTRTGGGPNPNAARDKAFAPVLLASGVFGLLLMPVGFYALRFADHMPEVWPRTWSGKPAVIIENLSVSSNSSGDHQVHLRLARPFAKKLKDSASIRCVYLCDDSKQAAQEVTEPQFATEYIGGFLARLLRDGDEVCGYVFELSHPPRRFLEGWPTDTRELQIPFFPADAEPPSHFKPAEREERAMFVKEASALLARGGGRLSVGMVIYRPRISNGELALSNAVTVNV